MIPELGHFALIIALVFSFFQGAFPIWASYSNNESFFKAAKPLNLGATFFVTLSFFLLLYSFAQDDFSVQYVALHSNSALPLRYKLSALWGGHEGSLLLWVLLLSLWSLVFNISSGDFDSTSIHDSNRTSSSTNSTNSINDISLSKASQISPTVNSFVGRVLSCLAWVNVGFILFLLATSNPFLRELPNIPLDGADLNPLLQDPGLIFHPPLLYMGYVGSAVASAFAVAALWGNSIPKHFVTWVRPWILASFAFLTVGISWGSYWAYYELGWGGWWFWDPVENASFLPWLTGLALIHALIVVRKRSQLYGWALLLMIITFGLSLLGTFLVRSGVLASVHSFATDPARGIFILLLLTLLMGSALLLYGFRAKPLLKDYNDTFDITSRETLLLLSSILIVVAAASILLGTLFPLIYDFFTGKTISVGFPYFNLIFIPLMVPVMLAIPLGPFTKWGHNRFSDLFKKMRFAFIASLIACIAIPVYLQKITEVKISGLIVLGLFCSFWVGLGTLQRLWHKLKEGGLQNVSSGAWGMILAHFGIAILLLGITIVSNYQIEQDLRLSPGDTVTLRGYDIRFQKMSPLEGSNFVGYKGLFLIKRKDNIIAELSPEKRHFVVQNSTMTETAIDAGFWRDIYIALGEKLENEQWSIRIYYKPLVRWIWGGALMVAFACFILVVFRNAKHKNLK